MLLGEQTEISPQKAKENIQKKLRPCIEEIPLFRVFFWLFVKGWGKMLLFCVTVNVDNKTQQAVCGLAALIFLKCC